eukprot:scaffold43284_cov66-Phaeocystis_antarctica.AAC.2
MQQACGGPFLSGRMVACAASPGARFALLSMRRRQVLPFARLRQEAAHLDHAGVVELCVLRHQDRVARVGAWSGFGFRFGARVWVRVGWHAWCRRRSSRQSCRRGSCNGRGTTWPVGKRTPQALACVDGGATAPRGKLSVSGSPVECAEQPGGFVRGGELWRH